MDSNNNSSITIEEMAMLLGQRDIEIYILRKQLQAAMERIANLEKKPDE